MAQKISDMTAAVSANLTDLFETSQVNGSGYLTKKVSNAQVLTLFNATNNSVNQQTSATSVVLTNPMLLTQAWKFSAPGQSLTLPATNVASSIPVGSTVWVINDSTTIAYDVKLSDGTTVIFGLQPEIAAIMKLENNSTANGNWAISLSGTLGQQQANQVAISGGTIDGTAIGNTTPSSGKFTTLQASTPLPIASGGTNANNAVSALANLGALPLAGGTLTGAITNYTLTPTQPLELAPKNYVDMVIQGLAPKPTATVATTAALPAYTYNNGTAGVGATITFTTTGFVIIEGRVIALNDLILVKNETSQQYNGLYLVTTMPAIGVQGVLTRSVSMDTSAEFSGAFIPVGNLGSVNVNSLWLANPATPVVVGTTAIPFTQLNGATDLIAGTGLGISGNTISIANTAVTPGSVGSAANTLTATVNAQGQLTALSQTAIQIAEAQVTNLPGDLANKQNLNVGISAKTADYTLVSGDAGKVLDCNPFGATFTITCLAASTAGSGYIFFINNIGTRIVYASSIGDLINGQSTFAVFPGQCVRFRCNATTWYSDLLFDPNSQLQQIYNPIQTAHTLTDGDFKRINNFGGSNDVVITIPSNANNNLPNGTAFLVRNGTTGGKTVTIATQGSDTYLGQSVLQAGQTALIYLLTNPPGNPNVWDGYVFGTLGKYSICIPSTAFYPALTNGATLAQFESATNKNNYRGWSFAASGNNNIILRYPMPKSWNQGTLTFILAWKTTATTGNVVWSISGVIRRSGDAEDLAFGTPVTLTSAANGTTQYEIITVETSAMTCAGTPANPSEIEILINRDGGVGSDTLAATAILTSVIMNITTSAVNDS